MRIPPRLFPALITPFTRTGDVDHDAYAGNLNQLSERGIKGFLVAGSTGEGSYLESGERQAMLDTTRTTIGATPFVLCGVASESLRGAVSQIEEAADGGADAALVMTPTSLIRGEDDLVLGYYHDLADKTDLPILVYSVPKFTGYEAPIEVVARIAEHDGIVGMKDSGGNPVRKAQILEAAGEDFYVFAGSSKAISLSMTAGAFGAIVASGNYAPELLTTLISKARRSTAAATEAQAQLTKLSSVVEEYGIPGVKTAAAAAGLEPGSLRRPLRPLHSRNTDQIRQAMGF